jgi:microcystin-dependent protein
MVEQIYLLRREHLECCVMLKKIRFCFSFVAALAAACLLLSSSKSVDAQFVGQKTYLNGTSGAANAQTISGLAITSYNNVIGVTLTLVPAFSNTGPMTLNFNSLGAVNVRRMPSGAVLGGGEVQSGIPFSVLYNGSNFYIMSPQDTTPVGVAIDLRNSSSTAPTGYLIEDGSCVSQTTYAALFSVVGTSYGSCSAGNFKLPDSRGTGFLAADGQGANGAAGRITTASCSAPNTVGTLCGTETKTLSISQLPTVTPAGTVTNGAITINGAGNYAYTATGGSGIGGGGAFGVSGVNGLTASQASSTFTGTPFGSGAAHAVLNPVLIGIRAIKF